MTDRTVVVDNGGGSSTAIVAIIVIVLLVAAAWFFLFGPGAGTQSSDTDTNAPVPSLVVPAAT